MSRSSRRCSILSRTDSDLLVNQLGQKKCQPQSRIATQKLKMPHFLYSHASIPANLDSSDPDHIPSLAWRLFKVRPYEPVAPFTSAILFLVASLTRATRG